MGHRKVQCWIFAADSGQPNDARCLLLKTNAARGAFWQPVTGSVEPGEGFFEAACREPLEETGFAFESPPVDVGYDFEFTSRFGVTRERVFVLTVASQQDPRLDPKEHQDFQWISPLQAIGLLRFPTNEQGLRLSFRCLFGKDLA
ncbi:MAG: NUDIX domain-containing protein [Deltaproteobacteria bacterium]|nr:NUDIX domain-containing protein [Deltaproteobacteria bacterium]